MTDEHIQYYPLFRGIMLNFEVDCQCVTHPFAMGLNPFDLHALNMPPAFILSQDQTLNNVTRLRSVTNRYVASRYINREKNLKYNQNKLIRTHVFYCFSIVNV